MKTADDIAREAERERDRLRSRAAELRGEMEDAAKRLTNVEGLLVGVERLCEALGPPRGLDADTFTGPREGDTFTGPREGAPPAGGTWPHTTGGPQEMRLNVMTAGPPPVRPDSVVRHVTQEPRPRERS